ncbi:hypothetical protein [Halobacillus litoralis]|uniref:hypothetical protein n=1 Tax=Halobacillus litoralis TaxID=45668 RepID=UPI001CD257B7|nr:hypothetical protein [Halobacillus litoralis]MCA1024080.1 hypothetical protein [Halobacillus litoralis]
MPTLDYIEERLCPALRRFADSKERHGLRYGRLRGKEQRKEQALMTAACRNMKKTLFHPARSICMKESLFQISEDSQGAVPLPLLRKNEWAEIAERGFCEEARVLVRGKGRGFRSWR